jgi:hypothetical protein
VTSDALVNGRSVLVIDRIPDGLTVEDLEAAEDMLDEWKDSGDFRGIAPQPNPRIKGSQIGIARKIRIKRTAAISSLPSASFSHGSRRAINAPWELALRSAP